MTTGIELFYIKGNKLKKFSNSVSDEIVYEVAYQPSLDNDIFIKYIGFIKVGMGNILEELERME